MGKHHDLVALGHIQMERSSEINLEKLEATPGTRLQHGCPPGSKCFMCCAVNSNLLGLQACLQERSGICNFK